jgi:phosphoglycerol transferase MdoB-like AlkP superfamily enzyme
MMKWPRIIQLSLLITFSLLLLMSLFRLTMYLYFPAPEGKHEHILNAFILGLRYDLRDVCIAVLPFFLLGSIKKFSPFNSHTARIAWKLYFILLTIVAGLFYVFDFSYYAYLQQRLNAQLLNFVEDAKISAGMVWQTYPVLLIIIGLILFSWLVKLLYDLLFRLVKPAAVVASKKLRITFSVIVFLLLALGIFGRAGQYPLRWSDAFGLGDDYLASLSLNPFQSFFSSLQFRKAGFDEKKTKEYFPDMARLYQLPSADTSKLDFSRTVQDQVSLLQFDPRRPPNVIIVICESFSAYKSSMWGNPLNTTPFFAQLCNEGYFFDRCFTPHWGTARGVWAIITGIPDVQMGNNASRNPMAVDQRTIINDFKGYDKFYFLGGSTSWANIRGLLQNNIEGLKIYEEGNFKAQKVDVWGVSDKNLMLESSKILGEQNKPFFAIIQTADNHRPYTIPKEDLTEFRKIQLPEDSLHKYGFISNDEFNAFRYTDFSFSKFMEAAKKEKYFSNTLFVFVGDHGTAGNASSMFPKAWTDLGLMYEHVPLLFYAPAMLKPKRTSTLASQIDILPSVVSLCKLPYNNYTLGRNLFALDTMKNNTDMAFIMDHDRNQFGLVWNDMFYKSEVSGKHSELVSILNNIPLPDNATTDSARNYMQRMTNAFYESSRYLLYHNKKVKGQH